LRFAWYLSLRRPIYISEGVNGVTGHGVVPVWGLHFLYESRLFAADEDSYRMGNLKKATANATAC